MINPIWFVVQCLLGFILGCLSNVWNYERRLIAKVKFYNHVENMVNGKEQYNPNIDYENKIKKELGLK